MSIRRSLSCFAVMMAFFYTCSIAADSQHRQEVRRSFNLNPGATVSLRNISGDIIIASWGVRRRRWSQ